VGDGGTCRFQSDANHTNEAASPSATSAKRASPPGKNAICENGAKMSSYLATLGGAPLLPLCSASVACNAAETCVTPKTTANDPTSTSCCDTTQLNKDGTCIPHSASSKNKRKRAQASRR